MDKGSLQPSGQSIGSWVGRRNKNPRLREREATKIETIVQRSKESLDAYQPQVTMVEQGAKKVVACLVRFVFTERDHRSFQAKP